MGNMLLWRATGELLFISPVEGREVVTILFSTSFLKEPVEAETLLQDTYILLINVGKQTKSC